jgi:acetyltransferase-like isoleucine patch superfamily enzyme
MFFLFIFANLTFFNCYKGIKISLNRNIWIIGASGFAFDIASLFIKEPGEGNIFCGFIDDRQDDLALTKIQYEKFKERFPRPVSFEHPDPFDFTDPNNRYMFGTGDPLFKKEFSERYHINGDLFHRLEQSPNISDYSITGPGLYWMCKISSNVQVGHACFIDAYTVIGHGTKIGNFCHIGVNVIIGGDTEIGEACKIHSGAIIGNKVKIGKNSIIGSGAIITRNLPDNSKVIAPKSINLA